MEDLYGHRAYAQKGTVVTGQPDVVAQTRYHVTVGEAPESRPSFNSVQEAARFAVQASMDSHDEG